MNTNRSALIHSAKDSEEFEIEIVFYNSTGRPARRVNTVLTVQNKKEAIVRATDLAWESVSDCVSTFLIKINGEGLRQWVP